MPAKQLTWLVSLENVALPQHSLAGAQCKRMQSLPHTPQAERGASKHPGILPHSSPIKKPPQAQLVPSPLKGQTILLPCLKEMTKGPRPSFTHTWLHKSSRTRRHGMRKFQLHPSCCSMQSNLPLSWQELNEREELLEQQHVAIMMQPNNPHLTSYLTTTQTGC